MDAPGPMPARHAGLVGTMPGLASPPKVMGIKTHAK